MESKDTITPFFLRLLFFLYSYIIKRNKKIKIKKKEEEGVDNSIYTFEQKNEKLEGIRKNKS